MGFYEYYLAHHGIKGQKWGVRRYQNEDGTLTPEGRARYQGEENGKTINSNREEENQRNISRSNVESELYRLVEKYENAEHLPDNRYMDQVFKDRKEINNIVINDPEVKEIAAKEKKVSDAYNKSVAVGWTQETTDLLSQLFKISDDKRDAELWVAYNYVMKKYPKEQAEAIIADWFTSEDWLPI